MYYCYIQLWEKPKEDQSYYNVLIYEIDTFIIGNLTLHFRFGA